MERSPPLRRTETSPAIAARCFQPPSTDTQPTRGTATRLRRIRPTPERTADRLRAPTRTVTDGGWTDGLRQAESGTARVGANRRTPVAPTPVQKEVEPVGTDAGNSEED